MRAVIQQVLDTDMPEIIYNGWAPAAGAVLKEERGENALATTDRFADGITDVRFPVC
jgi:hypothetical protein